MQRSEGTPKGHGEPPVFSSGPGNGIEQSVGGAASQYNGPAMPVLKEQDRFLPIANISRLMKSTMPDNSKVSKEAKECMQECVSEFICFITSEASDICDSQAHKCITAEDVFRAMDRLGFDMYEKVLRKFYEKYRLSIGAPLAPNLNPRRNPSSHVVSRDGDVAKQQAVSATTTTYTHGGSGAGLPDPAAAISTREVRSTTIPSNGAISSNVAPTPAQVNTAGATLPRGNRPPHSVTLARISKGATPSSHTVTSTTQAGVESRDGEAALGTALASSLFVEPVSSALAREPKMP